MAYDFKITRRVEFADTDMAGIMHFTAFYGMMEVTEHAFYRTMGFSVHLKDGQEIRSFPRLAASCEFKKPLRFEDEVEIHLLVKSINAKTIEYVFIFRLKEAGQWTEVARGSMTVIYAIKQVNDHSLRAADLPEIVKQQLEEAPSSLLED
jgi:acyl-CoA thioester hydrolase